MGDYVVHRGPDRRHSNADVSLHLTAEHMLARFAAENSPRKLAAYHLMHVFTKFEGMQSSFADVVSMICRVLTVEL